MVQETKDELIQRLMDDYYDYLNDFEPEQLMFILRSGHFTMHEAKMSEVQHG